MAANIFLLHGDDQVAIQDAVRSLQAKLGDATTAEMNTTRFEGAGLSVDPIHNATHAAPFLSERRLVIVTGAGKAFSAADAKARFTVLLGDIPETTDLVLIETSALESKHWLLKWIQGAGQEATAQKLELPEGPAMAAWLQARAKELGGELQPQAATALAQLVGSEKLAAEQELHKLLAYADYTRAITAADVTAICQPLGEQGDFFALIDAIGAGNSGRAMQLLETLLQERDLILLFFSLVSHFRLLLQTRELLDLKKTTDDVAKELRVSPGRAYHLVRQAKQYSLYQLQELYNQLLDLDEKVKTGEMEFELATELFVASLSQPAR